LKVFIDLDDTLADLRSRWLQTIKDRLGETLTEADITSWDRLADKHYQELLREPGFFRQLAPEPNAWQQLTVVRAQGHELFIVSAAGPWNYADKDWWIHHHMPGVFDVKNVIFATRKHFLAAPGRLLIDDGKHNIEAWREAGGSTIVFDRPWNQDAPGPRMRNWCELPTLLAAIERGEAA
jgi:5'(3')-deoxyribonucleotidase